MPLKSTKMKPDIHMKPTEITAELEEMRCPKELKKDREPSTDLPKVPARRAG